VAHKILGEGVDRNEIDEKKRIKNTVKNNNAKEAHDKIEIFYLFIFNCNWVDTRWQQCRTRLHTNSTQNTENGTYII
jgi:hypothetical protein